MQPWRASTRQPDRTGCSEVFLVRAHVALGAFWLGQSLLSCSLIACSRTQTEEQTAQTAQTSQLAVPTSSVPVPTAPSVQPSQSNGALDRLQSVAKPLSSDCADPRAVLAVRKRYDRSGRLFVQQTLLAYPEFQLVPETANKPYEIDVYETIYGPSRFGMIRPDDPLFSEAVVARCGDVPTCNQLAALFEALQPKGKVTLSCGVPPATTGGFGRVAELSPKRFVLPDANAPRVAICARIAACGFREGAPLAASAACERASAKLGSCSAAADCAEVVRCSGISRKPHGTTSVVGSVSPKGNGWYGQADLAGNVWDVEPRLETRSWSWACEL